MSQRLPTLPAMRDLAEFPMSSITLLWGLNDTYKPSVLIRWRCALNF